MLILVPHTHTHTYTLWHHEREVRRYVLIRVVVRVRVVVFSVRVVVLRVQIFFLRGCVLLHRSLSVLDGSAEIVEVGLELVEEVVLADDVADVGDLELVGLEVEAVLLEPPDESILVRAPRIDAALAQRRSS